MKISNKTYDTLKLIALVAVPIMAFIGALCTIWNVPHSEQITASLAAFDTLLGALVAIAAKKYNKPQPMDVEGLEYLEDGDEDEQD